MARVRYLERADLAPEHQPLYDEIAARRGGVPPNFKALLNSPVASARMAVLGAYMRFGTPLPGRVKGLELLETASHLCCHLPDCPAQAGGCGVIDLLMLIGYYYCLAHTLAALEVGLPAGVPSTLSSEGMRA